MGSLLVIIAVVLFIASIVVLVIALRRPKQPARWGGRFGLDLRAPMRRFFLLPAKLCLRGRQGVRRL